MGSETGTFLHRMNDVGTWNATEVPRLVGRGFMLAEGDLLEVGGLFYRVHLGRGEVILSLVENVPKSGFLTPPPFPGTVDMERLENHPALAQQTQETADETVEVDLDDPIYEAVFSGVPTEEYREPEKRAEVPSGEPKKPEPKPDLVSGDMELLEGQLLLILPDYESLAFDVKEALKQYVLSLWEIPEFRDGATALTREFVSNAVHGFQEGHPLGSHIILQEVAPTETLEATAQRLLSEVIDGYDVLPIAVRVGLRQQVLETWAIEEFRGESVTLDQRFVREVADGYEYEKGKRIRLKAT